LSILATTILIRIVLGRPIGELVSGTERIATGDLNYKVTVPSKDEIGELAGSFNKMSCAVQEATNELEESNKKLREIDKRKSEFVAIVSHDLRTPLTSIIGFADTVLNKELKLSEQETREYINIIKTEAHRLGRLISDFLNISEIEEGKLQIKIEKTNISELIGTTKELIDTKTKEIKLSIEIEKNLPDIYLDGDKIRQVLQNIIGNALKYSPVNSELKIIVRKYQKELQICVIDKGPGIADDKKKIIFEKFYRGDDEIAQKERGIGLGLAIAKSIIEMHNGKIWVEDEKPSGSRFIFTLPIK
ncbi:MAG: ATP-binding protein, partial [Elusimicrobiota bacterium]